MILNRDLGSRWKAAAALRSDHPLALGMLPGDSESIAYKINNLSQTVGFSGTDTAHGQAVLWLHGQPVNLGRLPNDSASIALSINDRSQVVGFSGSDIFAAAPGQAVLWQDSKMIPLVPKPGDTISVAYGINNWTQIVGASATSESSSSAVVWLLGPNRCALFNVPSSRESWYFAIADRFYWYTQRHPSRHSSVSGCSAVSTPFFWTWLMMEIWDEHIPEPQSRSNPRVVKKPRSKFPSKKPFHRGTGTRTRTSQFFHSQYCLVLNREVLGLL